jgi:predicted MPP superfamily phosphohydrolase
VKGFRLILALATLADAAAALAALLRPGPITAGRLVGAVGVAGLTFLAKLPVLRAGGLKPLGAVHLAFLDLTVALPLLGKALLWSGLPRRAGAPARDLTAGARLLAGAVCALGPVGLYATRVEPFRLRVHAARVPLPAARAGAGPLRLGVLADLQTDRVTAHERRAVERLLALAPDLILLPGDLFQGTDEELERELPRLRGLLARLSAPGGVYLAPGDHDRPDVIARILEGTGVRMLANETARLTVGDRRITLAGVELDWCSPKARATIRRLEAEPGTDDVRILLAHRPDAGLLLAPGSRVDLVVAGHTHGGQVVLPWFGPPVTLSRVPRAVGAGGLHRLPNGQRLYVSRGVGLERDQAPRIRFLCPPEVALLELGDSA